MLQPFLKSFITNIIVILKLDLKYRSESMLNAVKHKEVKHKEQEQSNKQRHVQYEQQRG